MLPSTLMQVLLSCVIVAGATAEEATTDGAGLAMSIDWAASSGNAKALAWAALAAGGHPSPIVAQALVRSLAARVTLPEGEARRCTIDAVLDQLIRGMVHLPSEVLVSLVDDADHQEQALILAAADPLAGAPALRHMLAGQCWQTAWIVACNVLAAAKDRGLAALLLRRLTIHLELLVTEPGHMVGFGSSSTGCGCGHLTVPAGFPPDPQYRLSLGPVSGDLVVATGPEVVTARRREYPPGTHGVGHSEHTVDRDALTAAYLSLLLEGRAVVPQMKTPEEVSIVWTDAPTYVATAEEARSQAERRWREVADALVAAGMLSAEERSALAPSVVVTVRDYRDDKHEALPAVPGVVAPVRGGGVGGTATSP